MNLLPVIFVLFVLVNVCWIFSIVLFSYLKRKRNPLFPDQNTAQFVFQERRASGNSDKTSFSKFGGASNCLTVRVTNTELWLSTPDIAAFTSKKVDMDHRIALTDIVEVRSDGKRFVWVSFRIGEDEVRTLRLMVKKRMAFIATIEDGRRRGGDMRGLVRDEREV